MTLVSIILWAFITVVWFQWVTATTVYKKWSGFKMFLALITPLALLIALVAFG